MNQDHDEFLCRIAKTLYYGDTSSFDTVSLPLTEFAAELYNEVKKDNSLERIPVQEVADINQNACVSTCSLVLAILYLEKIKTVNPEYVEKVAPSELFLVSLLVASKFLNDAGEDDSVSNAEWATCAGIPLKKVNEIEQKFLNAINWEIHIAEKQFWSKLSEMERYLANQEGKRRGWYSYTELNVLMSTHELSILKELIKQSALCITCYTTGMLSLITAGLLAIQVKYFLYNYVVYMVINQNYSMTSLQPCTYANSTSVTSNLPCDLSWSEIVDDLILDKNPSSDMNDDIFKNICDNSFLACYYANLSSETYFLKIEIPSYDWITHLVRNNKPQVVQKNSLL